MTSQTNKNSFESLRTYKLLDQSVGEIVDTAKRNRRQGGGPIPLSHGDNKYCVLRGPHVDKKSTLEQLSRSGTHKRLIDILDPRPAAARVDALMKLDPFGRCGC